jgi:hypothetical protein
MSSHEQTILSVVIRIVGGQAFIHACLCRLLPQIDGRPIEVIVPYDSTVDGVSTLKKEFPQVIFVDMGVVRTAADPSTHGVMHELYDRRTAKGLSVAQGDIIALLEDYGLPDPDWCDQILEAHRYPHGIIGGAVEHAGGGALNWAVYFLDFARYQLPLCEGPAAYLTDVNVSYKRDVIESVRRLWEDRYNEVTVHWALARQQVSLWQRPQIVVRQYRGRLSFFPLVVERFCWGRLFGCMRVQEKSFGSRLLYSMVSPGIPLVLLGRIAKKIFSGRRNRFKFFLVLPQLVTLTLFWCLGEFVGYVTGRESSS